MTLTKQSSNRAEEIRKKRTTGSRARSRPSIPNRGNKSTSAAHPPILGRRGFVGEPVSQKRPNMKKIKRRFDFSLGASGAEMRLPSLPVIHLGWRLVSGMIVTGLLYCLYTVWTSPVYLVNFAEVEGIERITWEEINLVAGVFDKPIFIIEPDKIQQDLQQAFPELSLISVKIGLPARVLILVEERQPIIAWRESEQTLWVDIDGFAFPPRGEPAPEIMVESIGSNNQTYLDNLSLEEVNQSQFISVEMVNAILSMSAKSPENTPLVYMPDHGLGWRDQQGWDVFFGRYDEEIEIKLDLYEAILELISEKQIQPVLISVEHLHAPYYRLGQ